MRNKKIIQALILIAVMLIGFLSEVMVVWAGDPVFMGGVMIAPSSPDKNPCSPNKKPCGSRQISAPIAPQTLKLIKEHQRQQEEIRKYLEQRELIERRIIIDVLSHPAHWKYHSIQSIEREIERRTRKELQPPRIFKFPTSLKPLCCPMQDPIKKIEPSIRAPRFPAESVTDLRCKELGRRLTEVNFALRVVTTGEGMISVLCAIIIQLLYLQ